MKSRIKQWRSKPKCGSTHGACRCFIEKIIDLELEVAEAREMRYERAMANLAAGRDHTMRVTGNSMMPIIKSRSKLTFRATNDYQVGDVVFCKVKGKKGSRFIDAHKITKKDAQGRFMIANNKGHENGRATQVYGRVIAINDEPFGRSPDA